METWQILAWLVLLTAMGLLDHLAFRLHWHNPRPPRRSGGSRTEPRCEHQWRTPEIPPRGPQRCLWCSAEREA